jgi:hypothetical protein
MKVETIEVLSDEVAAILSRQARWERRKERGYVKKMTAADIIDQFAASMSAWLRQNLSTVESPLPPIAENQVRPHETPEVIALLLHAQACAGRFVLVEFSSKPSSTLLEQLRAAATSRNLAVHVEHLIGGSILLKVNPNETSEESDEKFLRRVHVKW